MKTKYMLFILLFVLIIANKTQSQVFEPDPLQFIHFAEIDDFSKTTSTFNNTNNRFKYNDFVYGFHWSGSVKMMFGFQWIASKNMNNSLK
jgi:hypothetical protein